MENQIKKNTWIYGQTMSEQKIKFKILMMVFFCMVYRIQYTNTCTYIILRICTFCIIKNKYIRAIRVYTIGFLFFSFFLLMIRVCYYLLDYE